MRLLLWWEHRQLIFLLTVALAFNACSEVPRHLKPGPLFQAAEKVPSAQAQVYVYWPAEEPSRWSNLLIRSCEGAFGHIQASGYIRIVMPPGGQCLQAEGVWEMESINAFGSVQMARLNLNVKPGQTLFAKVEKGRGLFSEMALRSMEPAKAEPEIRECGQMVPMTEDEMLREWQAREAG